MRAPKWAQRQGKARPRAIEQAARVLTLYILEQEGMDLTNKSEVARQLGISRHTLDRDLYTLQAALTFVTRYKKLCKETDS